MFYIRDRYTGHPSHFHTQKAYPLRVVAQKVAKVAEETTYMKASRIDVVEISKSARLRLENQAVLNSSNLQETTHG